MALQTAANNAKQREKEGRQALGIARGLRLMRAANLLLTSVGPLLGRSKSFDGDVRMVRAAVEAMGEWAQEEGIKS